MSGWTPDPCAVLKGIGFGLTGWGWGKSWGRVVLLSGFFGDCLKFLFEPLVLFGQSLLVSN